MHTTAAAAVVVVVVLTDVAVEGLVIAENLIFITHQSQNFLLKFFSKIIYLNNILMNYSFKRWIMFVRVSSMSTDDFFAVKLHSKKFEAFK